MRLSKSSASTRSKSGRMLPSGGVTAFTCRLASLRVQLRPSGVQPIDRIVRLLQLVTTRGQLLGARRDRRVVRGRFAACQRLLGSEDGRFDPVPLSLLGPGEL